MTRIHDLAIYRKAGQICDHVIPSSNARLRLQTEDKDCGLIRFYRTKNGVERTDYMMPQTRQALLRWRDHLTCTRERCRVHKIESDRVFCRTDGTPFKRFDAAWTTVKRIAGISDFHFHDLRHTFCSNLLLSGADLKTAKEIIGHRDLAMTDRYAHLTQEHKHSWQGKLAKYYAGI